MVQKFTICILSILKILYLSGMFAPMDEPMLMNHYHPKSVVQCKVFMFLKVKTFKSQILSLFYLQNVSFLHLIPQTFKKQHAKCIFCFSSFFKLNIECFKNIYFTIYLFFLFLCYTLGYTERVQLRSKSEMHMLIETIHSVEMDQVNQGEARESGEAQRTRALTPHKDRSSSQQLLCDSASFWCYIFQ